MSIKFRTVYASLTFIVLGLLTAIMFVSCDGLGNAEQGEFPNRGQSLSSTIRVVDVTLNTENTSVPVSADSTVSSVSTIPPVSADAPITTSPPVSADVSTAVSAGVSVETSASIAASTSDLTTDSTNDSTSEGSTISETERNRIIQTRPNELGELLIILYHHIGGEDSLYYRSVSSFRKDLQSLYDKGYRLISMEDYINSSFHLPLGTTPAILTFDDGAPSHFKVAFDSEGNPIPDPDCAVGIIDAFCREHPDFGRHAVFYLNFNAFREPSHLAWKLKYLYDNGYEIGNHTLNHTALDTTDSAGIQLELGKNDYFYQDIFSDIKMTSVAYPYGNRPKPESRRHILNGDFEGRKYEYKIGLIAGWCPTKPLYSKEMDPLEVYRVQGGVNSQQLDWWLELLEREPHRKFISDGIPEMTFIPKSLESDVNSDMIHSDGLVIYE